MRLLSSFFDRLFSFFEHKRKRSKMACHFLHQPVRSMETETGRGDFFDFAVTCCQGWRSTQEDVHLAIADFEPGTSPKTSLFAVFDGHNGIEVAEYAGKYLPDYIRKSAKYTAGAIEAGLKEAFLALDKAIKRDSEELATIRAKRHPNLKDMFEEPGVNSGCTAVVCLLKNDTFYCANIGDSRCVLSRDSKAFPLSQDHNPDVDTENKRIKKAGGTVIFGRINSIINVSRAFGDHYFKDNDKLPATEQMIIALPDVVVSPFNRATDRALILMCDGIWNSMDNDEVVKYVQGRIDRNTPLAAITEAIITAILPDKMVMETGIKGKDNMTMMVVKFAKETQ